MHDSVAYAVALFRRIIFHIMLTRLLRKKRAERIGITALFVFSLMACDSAKQYMFEQAYDQGYLGLTNDRAIFAHKIPTLTDA